MENFKEFQLNEGLLGMLKDMIFGENDKGRSTGAKVNSPKATFSYDEYKKALQRERELRANASKTNSSYKHEKFHNIDFSKFSDDELKNMDSPEVKKQLGF